VTEVVVVVQSDLTIPTDTDGVIASFNPGPLPPMIGGFETRNINDPLEDHSFPVSLGFTSAGTTPNFSITVQLLHGVRQGGTASIAVSRTVTDIRFIDQKMMMLVLPLLRACACDGTSCPNTDNPDCESFHSPSLDPLDPAVADPSPMMIAP
jgi:hypothetical protein